MEKGKKLLVVVDYQNDFVSGSLGFPGAEKLDDGIAALMKEFHEAGHTVVLTKDTHQENYLSTQEGRNLPVKHCILNTDGWNLYGKTGLVAEKIRKEAGLDKKKPYAHIFHKGTFGSSIFYDFLSSGLLEGQFYDEVHFVGLVTNICVISNAILAKTASPESKIVIHQDLCASFSPELHQKAIDVMAGLQMEII